MNTMNTENFVTRLHNKLQAAPGARAIFLAPSGKLATCSAHEFDLMIDEGRLKWAHLVGIYDRRADRDWIELDVEYMRTSVRRAYVVTRELEE
jgi:hypothetical protein